MRIIAAVTEEARLVRTCELARLLFLSPTFSACCFAPCPISPCRTRSGSEGAGIGGGGRGVREGGKEWRGGKDFLHLARLHCHYLDNLDCLG